MDMDELKIKRTLIQIGASIISPGEFSRPKHAFLNKYADINIHGAIPGFWDRAASGSSCYELACLTLGLAYVEKEFGWGGGSVASCIWLFRQLVKRQADVETLDTIAGWILKNTNNPYNPFGTCVTLGAQDYSEYMRLSKERRDKIDGYLKMEAELEEQAEKERLKRKKMAEISASLRNTETRQTIIKSMNGLSLREKLEKIAGDPDLPPQFYPTCIADSAKQDFIDELPWDISIELAKRLKGKRRGPWGKFRKRLIMSLGNVWNKNPWDI